MYRHQTSKIQLHIQETDVSILADAKRRRDKRKKVSNGSHYDGGGETQAYWVEEGGERDVDQCGGGGEEA
jgi:hypothetical protein